MASCLDRLNQILPLRIIFLNQSDLPVPIPFFEPFLTKDGIFHSLMKLHKDKSMDIIFVGEAVSEAISVLPDPPWQVTGHTNIECAPFFAGKDVGARLFHWVIMSWNV